MFTKVTLTVLMIILLSGCAGLIAGKPVSGEIIKGSGEVTSETREVSGFRAVTLQGAGALHIDQTGKESLTIRTDDNLMPYIMTEVRGDTLTIWTRDNAVFADVTELTFEITAAELEEVELAGTGRVDVSHLDTDTWMAKLPGAGSFDVSGKTVKQTVELEGAGGYNAENLESKEAVIRSSGAGMAIVRVSDKLDVTIDGLGNVQYIGDPIVKQTINGMGSVNKR